MIFAPPRIAVPRFVGVTRSAASGAVAGRRVGGRVIFDKWIVGFLFFFLRKNKASPRDEFLVF